jgi:hypothetical protein
MLSILASSNALTGIVGGCLLGGVAIILGFQTAKSARASRDASSGAAAESRTTLGWFQLSIGHAAIGIGVIILAISPSSLLAICLLVGGASALLLGIALMIMGKIRGSG